MGISHAEHKKISAQTAAYQVLDRDLGTYFTTRGASGSVTFTLPNPATIQTGWWCTFYQAADQNMVIASYASADNITTKNDLTADSITFSTATELIGNEVEVTWDGTGWDAAIKAEETVTATIA